MAGISEDRERQVVPRWRNFHSSVHRGELAPLQLATRQAPSESAINSLLEDWNHDHSTSVAADLVSSAFTLGLEKSAVEAAEFILSNPSVSSSARRIAAQYLHKGNPPPNPALPLTLATSPLPDEEESAHFAPRVLRVEIQRTRSQLVAYPRNPILWSHLSRLYTTVNSQDKATRAMRSALTLARTNRYILRSASRMYLHQGENEHAHRLLASAESLKSDPWILAAEIATAASNHKTSRLIKVGHKMLERGTHSPFHLSELASALGTLEAQSGNVRASRKLIRVSLADPSENAIAQAAWLIRNGGIALDANLSGSYEASAWSASQSGEWDTALQQAGDWQDDQPFSSRPAAFGSHLASVLEQHRRAIQFAQWGLLSSPEDFTLLNNLAFSLLLEGNTSQAAHLLQSPTLRPKNSAQHVVLQATTGLFYFRMGNPEMGRRSYSNALSTAALNKLELLRIVAQAYWAFEELRTGSSEGETRQKLAIKDAEHITTPWVVTLVERLRRYSR